MRRLVFIDDDPTELNQFRAIVESAYEYETVEWPSQETKLFSTPAPSIYVSDLYLPPPGPETAPTAAQRDEAKEATKTVAGRFSDLYADPSWDDKTRLQETMKAMTCARALLDRQWEALGQSPNNGIALCKRVMERHPHVPFVFYSRKITPEDVVNVLRACASDAIRKGVDRAVVLSRLQAAQDLYARKDVPKVRALGLNVNITIIPSR